jgi:hypothetical protein
MKLKADIDFAELTKKIGKCQGQVYFCSEGNQFNLKSVFSQYVFYAVTGNPNLMEEGELYCTEEKDYDDLREFLSGW